jgi:MoxR-like ATPase
MQELSRNFKRASYVASDSIITTIYLALLLQKPVLIEGEAGCGKTEIAKVLSEVLGVRLIRLQCYEGLEASSTIYEWNYMKQLLRIRMEEGKSGSTGLEDEIFSYKYLLKRPLLQSVLEDSRPVLLIDEIDRADEEVEGFLLEFLGEFQVTIPELETIKAKNPPIVVITSNRTRELSDGLRRRCLYLYISYPDPDKELEILKLKVPNLPPQLARQLVQVVSHVRGMQQVIKKPGVSETLDMAAALVGLGARKLDESTLNATLGCLVKSGEEAELVRNEKLGQLVEKSLGT